MQTSDASTSSQNDSEQINSSLNESFNQSKNSSKKFNDSENYDKYRPTGNSYDDHRSQENVYNRRSEGRWPESATPFIESKKSENENNFTIYLVGIIVVIVAVSIGWLLLQNNSLQNASAKIKCPQITALSKQYSRQEPQLWKSLKTNIENVLNQTPKQPGIFLLAYNDRITVERIMADIINATTHCMHSRDPKRAHPIQLNGGTFATAEMLKDYGVVISRYRNELESEGIMYVADLHETPAEVAQAFHTICDAYTPLVHKSIIFFTLFVEDASSSNHNGKMSPNHVHHLVESKLQNKWGAKINDDTLHALIGRVTDQVFFIHPEKF